MSPRSCFERDGRCLEHRDADVQDVARTQRLQPAQLVDAGRDQRGDVRQVTFDQHPHDDGGRVPAARDQAAERTGCRRTPIDVDRLRIVADGELHDLLFVDLDRAIDAFGSRPVILEVAVGDRNWKIAHVDRHRRPPLCGQSLCPTLATKAAAPPPWSGDRQAARGPAPVFARGSTPRRIAASADTSA